jgi:hypothetical protein
MKFAVVLATLVVAVIACGKAIYAGTYYVDQAHSAIDKGTSAGAPSTDVIGVPRPQLQGFDIGGYEYRP